METLPFVLSEKYLFALGWMIVHSIWQIAGIGILLWLSLHVFNRKSASFQYKLSLSALLLIAFTTLATFLYNLPETSIASPSFQVGAVVENTFITKSSGGILESSSDWIILNRKIENWIPTLVKVWFLGSFLFLVRLGTSLADIRNLSKKLHDPVDNDWQEVLQKQMNSLGLSKPVNLLRSVHVDMPMTFGILKSVILIPSGLFFQISPAQMEAIIAHELAHIQRQDYLVNIFQTVMEAMFFYHPVFWWVNNSIKKLREDSCDDMAIQMGIRPSDLAHGLANVLNHSQHQQSDLAMAAIQSKNPTLTRIKRILGIKNSSPKLTAFTSMTLMITLLMSATLLVVANDSFSPKPDFETQNLQSTTVILDPNSIPTLEEIQDSVPPQMDFNVPQIELGELPNLPEFIIPPFPNLSPLELDQEEIGGFESGFFLLDSLGGNISFPREVFFFSDSLRIHGFEKFDTTKLSKAEIELKKSEIRKKLSDAESKRSKAMNEWQAANKKQIDNWKKEMEPKMIEFQAKMREWQLANESKMDAYREELKIWMEEKPNNIDFERKVKEWAVERNQIMNEFQQKMEVWQKDHQQQIQEFQKNLQHSIQKGDN